MVIVYSALYFFPELNLATTYLKFSLVVICFLYVLLYFLHQFLKDGCRDRLFLMCALLFTVLADIFLLVLNRYYDAGVSIFILAQLLHFIRASRQLKERRIYLYISIALRAFLCVGVPLLLFPLGQVSSTNILSMVYFPLLVMNLVDSLFMAIRIDRQKGIYLSIGFFLFLCCDISVGLSNLGVSLWWLIWIFYGPSQILIALSLSRVSKQ
ncbi:MAG: hypothetical protein II467_05680 [Bacilli bacterium]|nr:hypothetical protein [Bacilli bacterium]